MWTNYLSSKFTKISGVKIFLSYSIIDQMYLQNRHDDLGPKSFWSGKSSTSSYSSSHNSTTDMKKKSESHKPGVYIYK